MKILQINTRELNGGAARAANRLHKGLVGQGIDSKMFVALKQSGDATVVEFKQPPPKCLNRKQRLKKYIRKHTDLFRTVLKHPPYAFTPFQFDYYSASRPEGYDIFSDGRSHYKDDVIQQMPTADIHHLHWITKFIDYRIFFHRAADLSPIVWTLHDMNAFTGGCHYDHGCGKYNMGCGVCPQLGSNFQNDLSHFVWQYKKHLFGDMHPNLMHIVTPSEWLGRLCKQSSILKKFQLTVIPNGIDTDQFSPRDREFSRDVLGIPQNADTILFVADSIDNRRKGFYLLLKALSDITDLSKLNLIILGGLKAELDIKFPYVDLGTAGNDRLLSLIYSAADMFVIPSIQDNLPNTVLESMSCGTPVIGFNIGGISEMIQNGINGYLVPAMDIKALRSTIIRAFQNKNDLEKLRQNCRRISVEKYSIEKQAMKYLKLYESLFKKSYQFN